MMTRLLKENQFETKENFKQAFELIMEPLKPFYKENKRGRLKLGTSGSVYSDETQQIEAFLRPLWGLGPYLTSYQSPELESHYLAGIIAGTNPDSPDYWGKTLDYDQRLVEMASLANTLLLSKEKTWDKLTKPQQENLASWLGQINHHLIPLSNWLFFRVLVNLALKKCGMAWDEDRVNEDLAIIDRCYIGNGWYYDEKPNEIDYYISFAIHYYSLIYYRYMKDEDPERSAIIKERAITFAQTFKYWFDEKGEAIPFGRSLSYRFSQTAFWTALVFADIEALPWGEVKGIISRHMKNWMQKDIFTTDGLLSIGYHYQNLVMAEGYNAPGSPYWSLKSFLMLAVPDSHPYWQAEAEPLTYAKKQIAIPEAGMLISQSNQQIQAFVAGLLEEKQAHVDAKYSKLVYSTRFGISVSKGSIYYKQGGFDNCLALAEADEQLYYRSKLATTHAEVTDNMITNDWQPWKDVQIKTRIIPIGEWHVRIHDIKTDRNLHVIDGGYSTPIEDAEHITLSEIDVRCESSIGTTSMTAIKGFENPMMQQTEPNTNLFFQRSHYPRLEKTLEVGSHRLISLVGGTEGVSKPPDVQLQDELLEVSYQGVVTTYHVEKGR